MLKTISVSTFPFFSPIMAAWCCLKIRMNPAAGQAACKGLDNVH